MAMRRGGEEYRRRSIKFYREISDVLKPHSNGRDYILVGRYRKPVYTYDIEPLRLLEFGDRFLGQSDYETKQMVSQLTGTIWNMHDTSHAVRFCGQPFWGNPLF